MPPVVAAAIITAGAGIGATAYGARSARRANDRAIAAEERSLDRTLAANREANAAALQWEREVEERRRHEWDVEQADERAQWDWYQGAMAPYRDASAGALGTLAQMVERLGGGTIPRGVGGGAPAASAPPAGWSSSSLVRTGAPSRAAAPQRRAAPIARMAARSGAMPRVAEPRIDFEGALATVADLVKNLPARAPNYRSDAYLG